MEQLLLLEDKRSYTAKLFEALDRYKESVRIMDKLNVVASKACPLCGRDIHV